MQQHNYNTLIQNAKQLLNEVDEADREFTKWTDKILSNAERVKAAFDADIGSCERDLRKIERDGVSKIKNATEELVKNARGASKKQ